MRIAPVAGKLLSVLILLSSVFAGTVVKAQTADDRPIIITTPPLVPVAKPQQPVPIPTVPPPYPAYDRQEFDPVRAEKFYQHGHDALTGGEKDRAIEEFELSCDYGNAKSCFNVGLLNEERLAAAFKENPNLDPKADPRLKKFMTYFNRACAAGFARGCVAAANYYRREIYGIHDLPRAVRLLQKACDAGEIGGCEELGELHYQGLGVEVDLPRAASLFKQGCDANGRVLSCFNYALMREKGKGIAVDHPEALRYYRTGCQRGSNDSCINLAFDYVQQGKSAHNMELAIGLFRTACNRGGLVACNNQGKLIRELKPSPESDAEAAGLFRKACDGGNGEGCRSLALLAQDGVTVAGSKRDSVRLHIKGCELNYGPACYNAGFGYWLGHNAPKSAANGLNYFGKGCKLGDASSCAGAALAATSLKKGDPAGGDENAKRWFEHGKFLDPENGLVKSLGDWLDKPKKQPSEAPRL